MDDAALRAELERHHRDAFAWALACCRRRRDDAEEALQTVYLMVLDGRAQFAGRSSFRTWLFGVIRRTAAAMRRRAFLRELLLERRADDLVPVPADEAGDDRGARVSQLRDAMRSLSARQREVLDLVFGHALTVEEAAEVMGVSVGSARTHYARGKARLATLLGSE